MPIDDTTLSSGKRFEDLVVYLVAKSKYVLVMADLIYGRGITDLLREMPFYISIFAKYALFLSLTRSLSSSFPKYYRGCQVRSIKSERQKPTNSLGKND
jgi:hypothetical protein